jgi:hypothetical protein
VSFSKLVSYSNAFRYRVSIAILRMANGLDYSFVIPNINGHPNQAFEHSNTPSVNNLNVVSSTIMHVNSNLELAAMGRNGSSKAPAPGLKNYFQSLFFGFMKIFLKVLFNQNHKLSFLKTCRRKFSIQLISSMTNSRKEQSTFGGFMMTVD